MLGSLARAAVERVEDVVSDIADGDDAVFEGKVSGPLVPQAHNKPVDTIRDAIMRVAR